MFGLGMPEILLILAIALIVIGPKKLPDLAKTLGRAMGEFKRSAQDFKKSLEEETNIKDIKVPAADLKSVIQEVNQKKTSPAQDPASPDKPLDQNLNAPVDETVPPGAGESHTTPDQKNNPSSS